MYLLSLKIAGPFGGEWYEVKCPLCYSVNRFEIREKEAGQVAGERKCKHFIRLNSQGRALFEKRPRIARDKGIVLINGIKTGFAECDVLIKAFENIRDGYDKKIAYIIYNPSLIECLKLNYCFLENDASVNKGKIELILQALKTFGQKQKIKKI